MSDISSPSHGSSIFILFVDANQSLLDFSKFYLERNGEFRVDTANSVEGILKLSHLPYDIIISGNRVEGTDGIDFLRSIRTKFGDVPFILLIAPGEEDILIDTINNGADFFLHKNGEREDRLLDLTHKIRQVIKQVKRRKETEILLQDSEKYISDIIDFLPDATFAIDHAGRVIAWNRAIEEMTGITARDILGKGNYEYATPFYGTRRPILIDLIDEPDETIAQFYSTRYRTKNSLVAETDLSHPKGNKISALVKVCRLYNKAGDYIGAIESIRDITELKKTEGQLRYSEERFRGMAERSSDLILILNNEMSPIYVSPSVRSILGYVPDELVGKHSEFALETIFSQSGPDLVNAVQATMRHEAVDDIEIRMTKKDGKQIFVNLHAVPVIQDDILTGVQVSIRDITERKKAESATQALMMSMVGTTGYNSLRTITSAISTWLGADAVMIGEIQPDRETIQILSIYLDGQEILNFTYPVKGTPCEQVMEYGFRIYRDNVNISFPDSKTLAELQIRGYIGTPLRNSDGQVFGTLCVLFRSPIDTSVQVQNTLEIIAVKAAADIERSHIDQALRKNQKMLAEAMDLANLVNWEYDVITDQFTFNDRFYAMYGTTPEWEGGYHMSAARYAREFVHPAEIDIVAQEVAKAVSANDPDFVFQREHRIIRRDGEIRYIMVRFGITKDDEGRTIKTHGANQDITDRKKAEMAIRQANRQLNLLSSITRHDILNMVTVILMYLDKMKMDCSDNGLNKDFQAIHSTTKMIQNQIEFTRIYEDLGVHEPTWQFLPDLCSTIHTPPFIVMDCLIDDILIFADPMLEKVFQNMLDNSIRHGEHVTTIRISSHQSDSDMIIIWEDNGVGIPVEEKEMIFDRGFGKHTGLGMFLAREILSLTDITIRETGEPEKGARFEICIPKEEWRLK
jgi:PAS domain S-box-containing protein